MLLNPSVGISSREKELELTTRLDYYTLEHRLTIFGDIMVDQDLIKNFIWESTKETFETMIFLPVEKADGQDNSATSASLICTITFTGQIQGTFSILCGLEGVEKIARAMLMIEGDDPMEVPDICDAFGELTNMVIGGIKIRMNDTTPDIQISIPSVTKGLEIQPILSKGMARIDVTAKADGQAMKMAMMYKSQS